MWQRDRRSSIRQYRPLYQYTSLLAPSSRAQCICLEAVSNALCACIVYVKCYLISFEYNVYALTTHQSPSYTLIRKTKE